MMTSYNTPLNPSISDDEKCILPSSVIPDIIYNVVSSVSPGSMHVISSDYGVVKQYIAFSNNIIQIYSGITRGRVLNG